VYRATGLLDDHSNGQCLRPEAQEPGFSNPEYSSWVAHQQTVAKQGVILTSIRNFERDLSIRAHLSFALARLLFGALHGWRPSR
jgi:hypothetical protein